MNKIIILENNGGRMANQIWQFANIYAYCREENYEIENYAFFAYQNYFNIAPPKNKFVNLFIFKFYHYHKNVKIEKFISLVFSKIIKKIFRERIIESSEIVYLPPSKNDLTPKYLSKIKSFADKSLYFCGWNLRNPEGLINNHDKIVEYFRPRKEFIEPAIVLMSELRIPYPVIVGVHIRQGDYKTFSGGKYYFNFKEVRGILDDFLSHQIDTSKILFLVCSDAEIDEEALRGLNYRVGPGTPIADLYALSLTDLVISSESTFSQWASYYGNINNINFSRENINWDLCFTKNNKNNPWLN